MHDAEIRRRLHHARREGRHLINAGVEKAQDAQEIRCIISRDDLLDRQSFRERKKKRRFRHAVRPTKFRLLSLQRLAQLLFRRLRHDDGCGLRRNRIFRLAARKRGKREADAGFLQACQRQRQKAQGIGSSRADFLARVSALKSSDSNLPRTLSRRSNELHRARKRQIDAAGAADTKLIEIL